MTEKEKLIDILKFFKRSTRAQVDYWEKENDEERRENALSSWYAYSMVLDLLESDTMIDEIYNKMHTKDEENE